MIQRICRFICAIGKHLKHFIYIWLFLFLLVIGSLLSRDGVLYGCSIHIFNWGIDISVIGLALALITSLLLLSPMNAVYGLMGTSGSIRLFFFNFILISFTFTIIYYYGFFSKAAVSYDINQPHIVYNYYDSEEKPTLGQSSVRYLVSRDTTISYSIGSVPSHCDTIVSISTQKVYYQSIGFWTVFLNTVLTSLMQEPTDFFSYALTFNAGMERSEVVKGLEEVSIIRTVNEDNLVRSLNEDKGYVFYWILVFQILISWIFFGVFISLLYSKFRYES